MFFIFKRLCSYGLSCIKYVGHLRGQKSMACEMMHLFNLLKDLCGAEIFSAKNAVTSEKEMYLICEFNNFLLV